MPPRAGPRRGLRSHTLARPSAEALQDGWTCEVTRTATDGTRNANSCLYGSATRAAWALGYRRVVTYTEVGETGASLRAAGWIPETELPPRDGWDCPARPREPGRDHIARTRWEKRHGVKPFNRRPQARAAARADRAEQARIAAGQLALLDTLDSVPPAPREIA